MRFAVTICTALALTTACSTPDATETSPRSTHTQAGKSSIIVLPDTQKYTQYYPDHFYAQTHWIREQKEAQDIRLVLHLGDIVQHDIESEWRIAKDALSTLDGLVPYALVPGNHDYQETRGSLTRNTQLNTHFKAEDIHQWAGESGLFEEGKIDNNYQLFSTGSLNWIVINLEWAPRDVVLDWANQVTASFPDRLAIVVTHAYLYCDGTRYDHKHRPKQHWGPHRYRTSYRKSNINDGEQIWQKFIRKHGNIVMTLSGHVLAKGVAHLESRGDFGNTVHQVLANYQMKQEGGMGFLRILEIDERTMMVRTRTYSPSYDRYLTDANNDFAYKIQPASSETIHQESL